jgi:hypothetical protein
MEFPTDTNLQDRLSRTWDEVVQRRLADGTAFTTGFTPAEVALPTKSELDQRELQEQIDRFSGEGGASWA